MDNSKRTMITFLASFILLMIAIIGATYAYFSATANVNEQYLDIKATNPAGLIYAGTGTLSLENAIPGDRTEVKEFTIENPTVSDINQIYKLSLVIDENGFVANPVEGQLIMYIGSGNCYVDELSEEPLYCENVIEVDLTDGEILTSGTQIPLYQSLIEPEEMQYYYTYIKFVNVNAEQDSNKNVSFGAHIEITDSMLIKSDSLPYNELSYYNKTNVLYDPNEIIGGSQTLRNYILRHEPIVSSGNGLYHHTSELAHSAEDNSYRYAGRGGYLENGGSYITSEDKVNNWLCFGESDGTDCPYNHRWRIMGIKEDGTIKIIQESIGIRIYDDDSNDGVVSNVWENSVLREYLNNDYLYDSNYMTSDMKNMLVQNPTWNVGTWYFSNYTYQYPVAKAAYDAERTSTLSGGTIGLMEASDYGFAALPSYWNTKMIFYWQDDSGNPINAYKDDWLFISTSGWTLTPQYNDSTRINIFSTNGSLSSNVVNNTRWHCVRPVAYLTADVLYTGGNGTYTNMYTITK